MTILSVLKYVAFNAMLAVTVTLATVYKIDIILAVANWVYGIEAAFYMLAVLVSGGDKFWESILKKPDTLVPWKALVEPGWVLYMFSLGHVFNGVCMTFTALAYAYLTICKYAKRDEHVE